MNFTGRYWWYVNIGSCKDFVSSADKPLTELMLPQFYAIYHQATMS